MNELIELIGKTYGIVGILILAPMAAAIVLYVDNRRLVKDHEKTAGEWESKLFKIQELRVQDAQGIMSKLVEIVSEQAGLNKETNMALERLGELLVSVTTTLNQVLQRLGKTK